MIKAWPDLTPPVLLNRDHDCSQFQCGEPSLEAWLKQRALVNLRLGASRTYVCIAPQTIRVIGYYALSMAHILAKDVTAAMRRNMPQYIPAILLGRLAVDKAWQGHGLGAALLQDAVERGARAAREVSARLILVDALSPEAETFYQYFGFTRLPLETRTLALDLVKYEAMKVPSTDSHSSPAS